MFLSMLLAAALPAAAQTVRAPALGRSVLPVAGSLSAMGTAGLAPRAVLPNALIPTMLPTASVLPALPSPAAAPALPPAAEGRQRVAAVVQSVSVPLAKAAGDPAAQAPVLSSVFEGRRVASPDAVLAGASLAARPRLAPAVKLTADETPAPPAPRPVWKTAGLYALRAAGFLGAAYGGFRVGDIAYLGAQFLGPWGVLLSLPILGGAAWWLGRRQDASPLGRSIIGGLFLSAGFVVIGQQVWDLVSTPLGLFVGIPVGVALALVASGLLPRRKKFTGEPPNLNRR